MQIFDFNIHLPCSLQSSINETIGDENTLSLQDLKSCYAYHFDTFKNNIQAANFMLFNQNIFFEADLTDFIQKIKSDFRNSLITALIDFRKHDVLQYIDKAIAEGIDCIKFHSYNQNISEADFTEIVKICQYAEEKGIMICIDTSYGTSKMFVYDNLKLACSIADFITKTPIVLLHSGGKRVIEAMLLADDKKNVFLDTSFSLAYYLNSSIETDFAYVYRKIGSKRVLYGSDAPYVNMHESRKTTIAFLEKHHFSQREIEDILFHNAQNLKSWL